MLVEVHATGGSQLDTMNATTTEFRRRLAVTLAKSAREGFVRFEPRVERDRGDRKRCVRQLPRRALDPQPPGKLDWRLADHAAKYTVEMERR